MSYPFGELVCRRLDRLPKAIGVALLSLLSQSVCSGAFGRLDADHLYSCNLNQSSNQRCDAVLPVRYGNWLAKPRGHCYALMNLFSSVVKLRSIQVTKVTNLWNETSILICFNRPSSAKFCRLFILRYNFRTCIALTATRKLYCVAICQKCGAFCDAIPLVGNTDTCCHKCGLRTHWGKLGYLRKFGTCV